MESKVAPLVYAFYCLRLCPPYWSCEGHMNQVGELVRLPQVWFYSRSPVYPRLIADSMAALHLEGRLSAPWHVCVCYTDHVLDAGFSLEPDVKMIERPDLTRLQGDLGVIADRLIRDVRSLAEAYSTSPLRAR